VVGAVLPFFDDGLFVVEPLSDPADDLLDDASQSKEALLGAPLVDCDGHLRFCL
jgi:hypothetical protein